MIFKCYNYYVSCTTVITGSHHHNFFFNIIINFIFIIKYWEGTGNTVFLTFWISFRIFYSSYFVKIKKYFSLPFHCLIFSEITLLSLGFRAFCLVWFYVFCRTRTFWEKGKKKNQRKTGIQYKHFSADPPSEDEQTPPLNIQICDSTWKSDGHEEMILFAKCSFLSIWPTAAIQMSKFLRS